MPPAAILRQERDRSHEATVPQAVAACEIRLVTDRAGFEALEAPWTALFERAGRADQVFQGFNWLWHWSHHFLDGPLRLSIVTGWSDGRLVMVWPLVSKRSLGLTILSWMGEPASQYGDVLVEPGPLAPAMLRQGLEAVRASDADVAVLRKTRRTSSLAALLAEAGVATGAAEAPFLDFGGAATFEAVEKRFSSKERSSRRRLARRLDEAGSITFVDDATGDLARAYVRRAFALKSESLRRRGAVSPALDHPAMQAFFIDAMTSLERPVGATINAVLCGSQPVGVALSLTCKGQGFGHILAHDTAFEKQGVGIVLVEQIFRTALRHGLSGFDMLAPADDFKMKWASGRVSLDDWAIPFTLKGTAFARVWLGRLRPGLKHYTQTAPTWLGTAAWPLYRWLGQTRHRLSSQD